MQLSFIRLALLLVCTANFLNAEIERRLSVLESASKGDRIGWVSGVTPPSSLLNSDQQNFYIVYPNPSSEAEKVFLI